MSPLQIAIGKARKVSRGIQTSSPTRANRNEAVRSVFGPNPTQADFLAGLAEANRQYAICAARADARSVPTTWFAGRILLLAQRRAAERAADQARADVHAEDRERRSVLAALRKMGFKREMSSGCSAYYHHLRAGLTVRVSDHEVPMNSRREFMLDNGGRSWANSRFSFVVGEDDKDGWIEDVRAAVELRS